MERIEEAEGCEESGYVEIGIHEEEMKTVAGLCRSGFERQSRFKMGHTEKSGVKL